MTRFPFSRVRAVARPAPQTFWRAALPLMASTLWLITTASAQSADVKFTATQSFAFERAPVLANEGGPVGEVSALELRLNATTRLAWKIRRANGHILDLRQRIEALGYTSNTDLSRLTLHSEADYQMNLDAKKRWQLRLKSQFSYSRAPGSDVFHRARLGAMLRFKPGKHHVTRAYLRFGYRDQNDARFVGFDQTEVLFELGHDWQKGKNAPRISGTVYGDFRRADADRFSYDEFGIRLQARVPVAPETTITGKLKLYQRDYNGAFSASEPVAREDVRLKISVQADKRFSKRMSGFAQIGWDGNSSNISARDYSGLTASFGVKITLR